VDTEGNQIEEDKVLLEKILKDKRTNSDTSERLSKTSSDCPHSVIIESFIKEKEEEPEWILSTEKSDHFSSHLSLLLEWEQQETSKYYVWAFHHKAGRSLIPVIIRKKRCNFS